MANRKIRLKIQRKQTEIRCKNSKLKETKRGKSNFKKETRGIEQITVDAKNTSD